MTFLPPEQVREVSQPNKFGTLHPVFSLDRISTLSEMINSGLTGRMLQKWNGILVRDNNYQPVGPLSPWFVPQHYVDPTGAAEALAIIQSDCDRAADLGVRWQVLRDPADAAAVRRILERWTNNTITFTADSRLTWSNRWPMFLQAAQLISDSPSYTPALHAALEDQTRYGLGFSTAYIQTENRAVWGTLLEVTSGAFLKDRGIFDRGIARWRELFEHDVKGNIPVGEVQRDANSLHYCNFLLDAMTQTAEVARFNGEWLYDYQTADGSTYRGLWENVALWTAHPETFTYWPGSSTNRIRFHVDPLHALWPNENSQLLIDTYTTTQDSVGYRQGILAYRDRPLWG